MKEIKQLLKIYTATEINEKTGLSYPSITKAKNGRELQLSEPVRKVLELYRRNKRKLENA